MSHDVNQDPILAGLNKEQYRAVTTPGSMLVLAGAGSGKTRVLSSRVAYNIRNGIPEDRILSVTFTNKAAREMRGRIAAMMGQDLPNLWVGTFHGICNQMLREFGRRIDVDPNFHILDTTDQAAMIKRILKEMSITTDDLKIRSESFASVVSGINKIKEDGGLAPGAKGLIEEVYVKYLNTCKREGAMDFSDLLIKTNEALSGNVAGMRDHYRDRFQRILVDEFQDTNPEQFKWLSLIKSPEAELFAVGDDDQSIYAFRGADPASMSKFLSGSAAGNIIRLEQNYRSTGNILEAANGVIAQNEGRIGKTLRTDAGSGNKVNVCQFENDLQEANYIARQIKDLLNDGVPHHEVAVLYRSNFQSATLEKEMLKNGVPYVIHGGTRYFERQEVKDVVAYLRLSIKPNDNGAFARVVNLPPRGLGARSIAPIFDTANAAELSFMEVAIAEARATRGKIQGFTDLIEEIQIAMEMMDLPDWITYVIEVTGLEAMYAKEEDGESRVKNIGELVSLARRYVNEQVVKPANAAEAIADFLSTFTLEDAPPEDSHQNRKKAVTLMTIHSSKGLEFEHVFLNGVEQGSIPHVNSLDEPGGVEEERRLMYVAITRAKKQLTLSLSENRMIYGTIESREPSQFLEELPEHAVKRQSFKRPSGGWTNRNQQQNQAAKPSMFTKRR